VVKTLALTQQPLSTSTNGKRCGVANMWTLVTRVELDLIGKCMLRMLDKHAISDSPQATKNVHFGKIARFSMGVNV